MKISFTWLDKKGKTRWPLNPSFNKYWSGKIWSFSIWKFDLSFDFREGGLIKHIKETIWKGKLKDRQN